MIQIRKRWPILTALGLALTYGANNYHIAGIENLRLAPRTNRPAPQIDANAMGFDFSQLGRQLQDNDIFGQPAPGSSAFANIPPWEDMLSVAEKFTMWQDHQSPATPTTAGTGFSLPGTLPIPLPGNLPSTSFQPGASAAFVGGQPSGLPSTFPNTLANRPSSPSTGMMSPAAGFSSLSQLPSAEFNRNISAGSNVPVGSLVQKPVTRTSDSITTGPTSSTAAGRLRIASFNLGGFGPAKLAKPQVLEMLVGILRQYDVVALQQVESTRDDILPLIIERLNQSGRSFDYLVGPRVGRENQREQFAFVFDTSRLETDRFQLYTVDDPEEIMTYDPLVAWFRCKGVAVDNAFTFSLVNIHINPSMAYAEQALLPNLIEAIESDGRNEDDWILLGDFAGSSSTLTPLHSEGVRFAIQDIPTDVAGERMLDTILFSSRGTTEFTGRAGAFDFLRKYNLSLEGALEISSHMPIWAEFSTTEGAEPGRIAPVAADQVF